MLKIVALVLTALLHCAAAQGDFEFLIDFNGNFSEVARGTAEDIVDLREFNSAMIHEINREMLLELAIMVPRMRDQSNALQEEILSASNIDDECREYALDLLELYVVFQNWDIQDCAYWTWVDLNYDSLHRFTPHSNTFQQENIRSVSQVTQTLGRSNPQDTDAVREELEIELDYYRTLRNSYNDFLNDEIIAHVPVADQLHRDLLECRDISYMLQDGDHELIRGYLDTNCYE